MIYKLRIYSIVFSNVIPSFVPGLKATFSILLAALILSTVFMKSVLVLNFRINQKEIAAAKCENKNKPEMNCEGKCYLSQQLKNAEPKEPTAPDFRDLKELAPFLAQESCVSVPYSAPYSVSLLGYCRPVYPIEACPGSVFHPPEA